MQEINALLAAAEVAEQAGKYDEAEQLANETLVLNSLQSPLAEGSDNESDEDNSRFHLLARIFLILGSVARHRSNYSLALEHYTAVIAQSEIAGDKGGIAHGLNGMGRVYLNLNSYEKALEYYDKSLAVFEEVRDIRMIGGSNVNMGVVYKHLGAYDKSLEYYAKAITIFEGIGEKLYTGNAKLNMGNVFRELGSTDKALECYVTALSIYEELEANSLIALAVGNVGIVYSSLGNFDKALEYYLKALAVHEELGEKQEVARVMGNIGEVYRKTGSYDKALEYFGKALAAHEEYGEKVSIAGVIGNIGGVYSSLGLYDKALEYYSKAVAISEELGAKLLTAIFTGNIGNVYAMQTFDGYSAAKAEEYLLKAVALCSELGAKEYKLTYHNYLAKLYRSEKRWEEADRNFQKFYELEKEVHSDEARKKAAHMEQLKQVAERERQVEVERAQANATRELLDLVLPPSIATRILNGERRIADFYPAVSVLFADIVGFTALATEIPAEVVIGLLNHVFNIFDEVVKRNGCEKIKTIGDGYMAIAGAPEICDDHAERIARAAIDMQKHIHLSDEIRSHLPEGTVFRVRIGIHTGAAVCGVIGRERFVWDAYSDAVNTAARMESSGKGGKIHVSEEFAWLLRSRQQMTQDNEEFMLEELGEMEIKGKGLMRTYYLEDRSK